MRLGGYRLCLVGLTVISVSRIHNHFSILAALRPGLVLVALAGFFALTNPKDLETRFVFRTRPARLVIAMGLMACLSAPFGISLGSSASFILSDYSKTFLFAVLVMMACRTVRDLYTLAWAYVIGTGILAWMAFFLFQLSNAGSKAERLGVLYSWDANDVGVLMLVGLALSLLTFQTAGRVGKLISGVTLLAIGITIARTGSRGAFVGFIVVGIALLFMAKSISVGKRIGFVAVTALGVLLFAPAGYWEQMATLTNPKDDYNYSSEDGRKQVAQRGVAYMLSHPIAGLGINNFSKAECLDASSAKVKEHVAGTGIRCTAPHNSYVQAGAELGIPGLVLWLMLIFGSIRGMLKLRKTLPASWARGTPEDRFLYLAPQYLAVAMVGFGISSAFVSFAWLDPVYFLAAMMAGLHAVIKRRLAMPSDSVVQATVRSPVTVRGSTRPPPPQLRRSR